MPPPVRRQLLLAVATGGYIGYLPGAPGTAGSIQGLLLGWTFSRWGLPVQLGMLFGVFMLGVASAQAAERWLGATDHRAIVIDEIVGMAVALLGLPLQAGTAIAAFALFRALDILKPRPINALERLPGGWGVMCDDLVAGTLTNMFLQGVRIVCSGEGPLIAASAAPM